MATSGRRLKPRGLRQLFSAVSAHWTKPSNGIPRHAVLGPTRAMPNGGKARFDRVGDPNMYPVPGRKIVKAQPDLIHLISAGYAAFLQPTRTPDSVITRRKLAQRNAKATPRQRHVASTTLATTNRAPSRRVPRRSIHAATVAITHYASRPHSIRRPPGNFSNHRPAFANCRRNNTQFSSRIRWFRQRSNRPLIASSCWSSSAAHNASSTL
mgnify:CR=1 FL=1